MTNVAGRKGVGGAQLIASLHPNSVLSEVGISLIATRCYGVNLQKLGWGLRNLVIIVSNWAMRNKRKEEIDKV